MSTMDLKSKIVDLLERWYSVQEVVWTVFNIGPNHARYNEYRQIVLKANK